MEHAVGATEGAVPVVQRWTQLLADAMRVLEQGRVSGADEPEHQADRHQLVELVVMISSSSSDAPGRRFHRCVETRTAVSTPEQQIGSTIPEPP